MSVQVVNYQNLADKQRKGYAGLSLDSLVTTTAITIKAGSEVEVAGALYEYPTDETESGGTWAGIGNSNVVYVYVVPSGSSATFIYSTTVPSWDVAKQGWYNGTSRCFAFLWKDSGGLYKLKTLMRPWEQASFAGLANRLGRPYQFLLDNVTARGARITVPASSSWTSSIQVTGSYGVPAGARAVKLGIYMNLYSVAAGAASLFLAFSDNTGSTPVYGSASVTAHPFAIAAGYTNAAGAAVIYSESMIDVPLNSSGQFYVYNSQENNVTDASCIVYFAVDEFFMGE